MMVQPQHQTMRSPLDPLFISPLELDQITPLSFTDELAIALYQAITDKRLKPLLSVLLTELLSLIALLILVLPVSLIVLRRFHAIAPAFVQSVLLCTVIALVAIAWINAMLWKRGQQLKTCTQVMVQIQRFNRLVHEVHWINHWRDLSGISSDRASNWEDALSALWLTRENLLHALSTEKLYRIRSSWITHTDPITLLENNLNTLMTLGLQASVDEYSHLFNEILHINVILHREMANLGG
jgi:hypothetical protein